MPIVPLSCILLYLCKNGSHGRPQKFFQGGGNVDVLLILFRLLTMQCNWTFIKHFTLSTPQRKLPMIRQQSQKCASLAVITRYITIIYTRVHNLFAVAGYVYFYELRPPQIASTSLFNCLSTKNAHTIDQGSQTRGPHVSREGIFCGPRCVLGIFI